MPHISLFPSELITWCVFLGSILGVIALSEMFARRLRVSAETTRRLVHVWVGIMIFLCPFIFDRPFYPIITAVLFTGINLLALRMEKFKGMHATERTSYGTVYFPVAFIILVLLFWDRAPIALEAGVILLALSDPLAAAVGQRWATSTFTPWRDPKSLPGTAAMLASSIILIALLMVTLYPPATAHGLDWQFIASAIILTALVATVAEGLSWRGSDNLSVPLAAATFLFLFLQLAPTDLAPFLYWSAGSLIVLGAVTAFGALSVSGLAGAWCLGEFIFLAGSWRWLIPIIVFFLLSSALTRLNRSTRYLSHKGGPPAAFGKRNVVQVLANGGMPLLIAVAFGIWGHGLLYLVFLSSLAAATADTWATEIGSWSKRAPRNIITREAMIKGESGGITLLGTTASLAGAFTIGLAGLVLNPEVVTAGALAIITIIGFTAALFDSVLGATVQGRFIDPATGVISERRLASFKVHAGWAWLDNNAVNLACTSFGALTGFILLVM